MDLEFGHNTPDTEESPLKSPTPSLPEAERWQDKYLGPLQQMTKDYPCSTQLDSIQVLSIEEGSCVGIWFRLIGPGLSLNLELLPPDPGLTETHVRLSMKAIPSCHRDMLEIGVKACSWFADMYMFIRRHRLHRWNFAAARIDEQLIECQSWASIVTSLMRHRNAFDLRVTVPDPELSPYSSSLLQEGSLNSTCDRLDLQDTEMEVYLKWRYERLRDAYRDEIESQDTKETLDMHFSHLAQWSTCVESA